MFISGVSSSCLLHAIDTLQNESDHFTTVSSDRNAMKEHANTGETFSNSSIGYLKKLRLRKRRKERNRNGGRQPGIKEKNAGHVDREEFTQISPQRLYSSPMNTNYQQFGNQDWLASNLSSIWQLLSIMHDDIKQIKRFHRLNTNSAKKAPKRNQEDGTEKAEESSVVVDEEDCNPQYINESNGCLRDNGTICSGNGKCSCGQCICKDSFYGSHCQCNDKSCKSTFQGMVCGGPDRGQCRCGSCICRPDFHGQSCECSTEVSNCESSKGELCSSNGMCECNRCHCLDGYSGSVCENSIYSAKSCERLKLCVLCLAFGKTYPQCAECNLNITLVGELAPSQYTCVMIHSNCLLKYSYSLPSNSDGSTNVLVQRSEGC